MRLSTRAVSAMDSLWPTWLLAGSSTVMWPPWSRMATSNEIRVRVDVFSKMSASCLPVQVLLLGAGAACGLEACREQQQFVELVRGEIGFLEEVTSVQRHSATLSAPLYAMQRLALEPGWRPSLRDPEGPR